MVGGPWPCEPLAKNKQCVVVTLLSATAACSSGAPCATTALACRYRARRHAELFSRFVYGLAVVNFVANLRRGQVCTCTLPCLGLRFPRDGIAAGDAGERTKEVRCRNFGISTRSRKNAKRFRARAIAARLATLKVGDNQHTPIGATSQSRAANMLNVGHRSIQRATAVRC